MTVERLSDYIEREFIANDDNSWYKELKEDLIKMNDTDLKLQFYYIHEDKNTLFEFEDYFDNISRLLLTKLVKLDPVNIF